jgi:hypothetical protein
MLVHLMSVQDPDLGVIVATLDEDGEVIACDAARPFTQANLTPHLDAAREWALELAELYERTHPGYAEWLRRMVDADLDS